MSTRLLFLAAPALIALTLGACTSETSDTENAPTPENATDYPSVETSQNCGGKCDDPSAAINSSPLRLVSGLSWEERDEDGETSRHLSGDVLYSLSETVDMDSIFEIVFSVEQSGEGEEEVVDPTDEQEGSEVEPLTYLALIEVVEGVPRVVSEAIDPIALPQADIVRVDIKGMDGEREVHQAFDFVEGYDEGTEQLPRFEDPFKLASAVNVGAVFIDPSVPAPDYRRADTGYEFSLDGTEFWQRWPGGHNPTFSYSEGSELGRKCMFASARRFEAIMAQAPDAMVELREETNWGGRFFNWNDDYSDESASGRPTGAVLWAWRTGLMKWISQTGADGTCYLPTLDMVERASANCLAQGAEDGEIEGCQAN